MAARILRARIAIMLHYLYTCRHATSAHIYDKVKVRIGNLYSCDIRSETILNGLDNYPRLHNCNLTALRISIHACCFFMKAVQLFMGRP